MRNRYLDLLRAAAIVRVIVYHLFGWPWLSLLLPAMGIMFALAGSLTAASLDKRSAGKVITSRLRRLLPPLWLLGAIAIPAMLYAGWAHDDSGDRPLSWKLALWILPVGDPPGSDRGIDAWEPLWYIRAYLWFVVLSPLLYLAYRKIGWVAVAAPIVLIAALDKTGFSLPFGRADAAMWDFATYGACWIAGFTHHDGRLARVRPGILLAAVAVLGGAALYWLRGHPGEEGYDLNDVSESQALWSLAFVLLALRWQPDMSWLQRIRPLDTAVSLLNARAVTIYLWHNIAIAAIWPVLTVVALDDLGRLDGPVDLAASILLTLLAVLAFGWVEDLAARRRPTLWPAVGTGRGPVAARDVAELGVSAPESDRTRSNGFGPEPASVRLSSLGFGDGPTSVSSSADPFGAHPASASPTPDQLTAHSAPALSTPEQVNAYPAPAFPTPEQVSAHPASALPASDGQFSGGARTVVSPSAAGVQAFVPSARREIPEPPGRDVAAAPPARSRITRDDVAPFPEAEVLFGLPDTPPRSREDTLGVDPPTAGPHDREPGARHAAANPEADPSRLHDPGSQELTSWFGRDPDETA